MEQRAISTVHHDTVVTDVQSEHMLNILGFLAPNIMSLFIIFASYILVSVIVKYLV